MRGKEGPKHTVCMYGTVKEQRLLLVKILLQGLLSRLDKSESLGVGFRLGPYRWDPGSSVS